MIRLKDRVAIVTGAAGGIGTATAARLATDGATVIMADINADLVSAEAAKVPGAVAMTIDLTSEDQIKAFVVKVAARFGRIDILHNNAAIQSDSQRQRDLDVVNLDTAAWDMAMAVNVRGAMLMCKYVIPHMIAGDLAPA